MEVNQSGKGKAMKCVSRVVLVHGCEAYHIECLCSHGHSGKHAGIFEATRERNDEYFEAFHRAFWDGKRCTVSLCTPEKFPGIRKLRFRNKGMFDEGAISFELTTGIADPYMHRRLEGDMIYQTFERFCKQIGLQYRARRADSTRKRKRALRKN